MSIEQVENYSTVFQVWGNILEKRQEVVRQTAKVYAARPHGQAGDQLATVLPRERIVWNLDETSFWGQPNEIKSIGAHVEVRPLDFDPTIDYSGAGRWFNEGDSLDIDPHNDKAFILVDCESPPTTEMLNLCLGALSGWNTDWYILDSGGSFHIIIDKLVSLDSLPKYFGQLIMNMAYELGPVKSKFYGHIGKYLIDYSNDVPKLKAWANSIRDKFGHTEDPISAGKLIFPIDLRYIAYVIDALADGRDDEGYLRLSSKHGSVPVLKAQQVDGRVTIFESENDPFNRKQLSLPMI